jgi:nuclease HARBI1
MLRFHKHLLVDNLQYWKNYFNSFAEKTRCKLIEFGIHYPSGTFRVAGFYDDTVLATCRPGSGPNKDGLRKSNYIQMAFYNGWKKHHVIKFQTLEFPNGMCGDIYSPRTFKAHDCDLLRDSQLNQRLAAPHQGDPIEYCVYGDDIFPLQSHTMGKHVGNLTRLQLLENRTMSKIRVANEWDYGVTGNFYAYVKCKCAQKKVR